MIQGDQATAQDGCQNWYYPYSTGVFGHTECKNYGITAVSNQVSEEGMGDKAKMYDRDRMLLETEGRQCIKQGKQRWRWSGHPRKL